VQVMALSSVSDADGFWASLKRLHGRLPAGVKWTLAVASVDGTKAVNILVADSIDAVRRPFEEQAGTFGTTEYFEADAANAVGLPKV
jgi:hypothetical protein